MAFLNTAFCRQRQLSAQESQSRIPGQVRSSLHPHLTGCQGEELHLLLDYFISASVVSNTRLKQVVDVGVVCWQFGKTKSGHFSCPDSHVS